MKKVSMQTIASNCKVSRVSVYKALSGQPGLSASTKKLILDEALKLGYFYEAKGIKENSKFIFIMDYNYYFDISEKFYNVIYREVEKELQSLSFQVELMLYKEDDVKNMISELKKMKTKIEGIIVAGQVSSLLLNYLEKTPFNVLCFDYFNPDYNLNFIYLDNYYNSYRLTNYLIAKGHKKIAFAGNLNQSSAVLDRYFGYRKALLAHGIEFNEKYHYPDPLHSDIKESFDLNDKPTAIICHCDTAASLFYSFLKINNIKVYDDISMVAFDNTFIAQEINPKLSTMGIENTEYSKIIVHDMLDIVREHKRGERRLVKVKIFERESVKDLA